MNDLLREIAPLTSDHWGAIDREARAALRIGLAARRFVDFRGPEGWELAAIATGRIEEGAGSPAEGVHSSVRRAQPLVELWAPFELSRVELEAASRGAPDPDLDPLRRAAMGLALAEDRAIFHGFAGGGIRGIVEVSPHPPQRISEAYVDYPGTVTEAVELLQEAGIRGPYGIALGPRCWTGLMKSTDPSGYPVLKRLRNVLDGPVLRAPAVDGAVVLSLRGGDFELVVGRDISVGYRSHDEDRVRLHLVESMTFRVVTPEAAVPLVYES